MSTKNLQYFLLELNIKSHIWANQFSEGHLVCPPKWIFICIKYYIKFHNLSYSFVAFFICCSDRSLNILSTNIIIWVWNTIIHVRSCFIKVFLRHKCKSNWIGFIGASWYFSASWQGSDKSLKHYKAIHSKCWVAQKLSV